MITIEEVKKTKDQISTEGKEQQILLMLSDVCGFSLVQREEINSLKTILREVEHLAGAERGNICFRIIRMKDEIEMLRAANKDLQAWFDDLKSEYDKLKREHGEAYERAAQVCDARQNYEPECPETAAYCADAIRALKSGEPK